MFLVSPLPTLLERPHKKAPPTKINSEKRLSMFCLPGMHYVHVYVCVCVLVFLTGEVHCYALTRLQTVCTQIFWAQLAVVVLIEGLCWKAEV